MSEFKASVAAVELFRVIFDEGGTMELGNAYAQLSNDSKKKVERKYRKVSTMVGEFPKYFALKREGKSRYVVEVRIPVEFCPDAGKKPGCQNRNCDKLHLCTHFLLGTCTFGEKCRKSHSIRDNDTQRVLMQAGLVFVLLKPDDLLSLLQKKVKEGEIQTTATSRKTPDACKHYNHQSGCSKGVNCPFLHVCSHYIEGDCKFKDGCKREHGFKDPHNIKVLKAYGLNDLKEFLVLTILQGRPDRKRSVSASTSDSIQSDTIPHRPAAPAISRSNVSSTGSLPSKEDNKDICGFHLRGKCNYGDGCMNCHTELPYLWQYQGGVPGSAAWENVSSDLNMMIEEAFCDVTNDSFRTSLGKCQYVIHFDDMIAKPREATNIHSLKLRRLSTVSSAKAPPGHIYSTKWCWYWKDENNKWQSYDTPDDDHAASTASSDVFEKNFQSDNVTHPFSAAHHKYTMHFGLWVQENDIYRTRRPVRRRPTFVSKEGMAEIAKRKRTLGTQGTAVTDSERALPTHWEEMDASGQDFKRVPLQTISVEYKEAAELFEKTLTGHRIHKIERVQNADLWMEYIQKKQRMAKKAGGDISEKRLFHGTSSDIVDAICQQGFDWRMCGKHGTAYGKGSYFASTAVYSHNYARATRSPLKQMFLAKVVVGAYAAGNSSFVRPPPKDASKPHGELFDSCVDNTVNPGLFVVFDNGQSYPELLITYS